MLQIERVGLDHSVNLINGGMLLLTKIRQIWVLDRSMLKNSLKVCGCEDQHSLRKKTSPLGVGAHENFALISDDDKEVRPIIAVNGTTVKEETCNSFKTRIERYSYWTRLVCSIAILRHILLTKDSCEHSPRRWHYGPQSLNSGT